MFGVHGGMNGTWKKKRKRHAMVGNNGKRQWQWWRAMMSTTKMVMEKGRKELEKRRKEVMEMVNDDINREEGK